MSPSRLAERHATLVLDASTVLNLLGTGRAADVLRRLGREAVVAEAAAAEVRRDPTRPKGEVGSGPAAVQGLVAAGVLRVAALPPDAEALFLALIGAPSPDGLGDGEAATLALAADIGSSAVAVSDDAKAVRVGATVLASAGGVFCTLDLLAAAATDRDEAAAVVFAALKAANMPVPLRFGTWVRSLVGDDALRECPSFPQRWLR